MNYHHVSSVSSTANSVSLAWDYVVPVIGYSGGGIPQAQGFPDCLYLKNGAAYTLASPVSGNYYSAFTHSGREPNKSYAYKLGIASGGAPDSLGSDTVVWTKPSPPTLGITETDWNAFNVTITPPQGETATGKYKLYVSPDDENHYAVTNHDITSTARSVSVAGNNKKVFFKASSVGTGGESALSATTSRMTGPVAPTVSSPTATSLSVTWSGITGASYELKRKEGAGNWQTISTNAVSSYTDSNLLPGTTYSYKVITVKDDIRSNESAEGSGTTSIGLPTAVSANASTVTNQVQLNWTLPAGITDANLAYKVNNEGWVNYGNVGNTTGKLLTGLRYGQRYDFRLKSIYARGESTPVSPASPVQIIAPPTINSSAINPSDRGIPQVTWQASDNEQNMLQLNIYGTTESTRTKLCDRVAQLDGAAIAVNKLYLQALADMSAPTVPQTITAGTPVNGYLPARQIDLSWQASTDRSSSASAYLDIVDSTGLHADLLQPGRNFEEGVSGQNLYVKPYPRFSALAGAFLADSESHPTSGSLYLSLISTNTLVSQVSTSVNATTAGTKVFCVSGWVKQTQAGATLSVEAKSQQGQIQNIGGFTTSSLNSWVKIGGLVKLPDGDFTTLTLRVDNHANASQQNNTVLWDDLSIKPVKSVTMPGSVSRYEIALTKTSNVASASVLQDGNKFSTATNCQISSLPNGDFYVHVRALDQLANASAWATVGPWHVDLDAPRGRITVQQADDLLPDNDRAYFKGAYHFNGIYEYDPADPDELIVRIIGTPRNGGSTVVVGEQTVHRSNPNFSIQGIALADGPYRFMTCAGRELPSGGSIFTQPMWAWECTVDNTPPTVINFTKLEPGDAVSGTTSSASLQWMPASDMNALAPNQIQYELCITTATQIPTTTTIGVARLRLNTTAGLSLAANDFKYTLGSLNRKAVTWIALRAIDPAGNASNLSIIRWIYGDEDWDLKWNNGDTTATVAATTVTLQFDSIVSSAAPDPRGNGAGGTYFIDSHDIAAPSTINAWQTFATTVPLTLAASGDFHKEIIVQLKDALGNLTFKRKAEIYYREPSRVASLELLTTPSLEVAPQNLQFNGQQSRQYVIAAKDQYGDPVAEVDFASQLSVKQHPASANVFSFGLLGARLNLRGERIGASQLEIQMPVVDEPTVKRTIEVGGAGPLAAISIEPADLTVMKSGGIQVFTAQGLDQAGNVISITPLWQAGVLGSIDQNSGRLRVVVTNAVVDGELAVTDQENRSITGYKRILVDGREPLVDFVELNAATPELSITTQSQMTQPLIDQQTYGLTLKLPVDASKQELALPAQYEITLDDYVLGTAVQTTTTAALETGAVLTPAEWSPGQHILRINTIDALGNESRTESYHQLIVFAGERSETGLDWLLEHQNLAETTHTEYGSWVVNGYAPGATPYLGEQSTVTADPADRLAASSQETAAALITLLPENYAYYSRNANPTIARRINVRESIEGAICNLLTLLESGQLALPTSRLIAAEALANALSYDLTFRAYQGDVQTTLTAETVKTRLQNVVKESFRTGLKGGYSRDDSAEADRYTSLLILRLGLLLKDNTILNRVYAADNYGLFKYLANDVNYETLSSYGWKLATQGYALNQWDAWNEGRQIFSTSEILLALLQLKHDYSDRGELRAAIERATQFLLTRKFDAGGNFGFGDQASAAQESPFAGSTVMTAEALLGLLNVGAISTTTSLNLLQGAAYLEGLQHEDHSWRQRGFDTALALRVLRPDLRIKLHGTPRQNMQTGLYEVAVTIENIGPRNSGAFMVGAYDKQPTGNSLIDRKTANLGYARYITGLAQGAQCSTTVTLQKVAPEIILMADALNQVAELNETNNCSSFTIPPQPDLSVISQDIEIGHGLGANFKAGSIVAGGDNWVIKVTVHNYGGSAVPAGGAQVVVYQGNVQRSPSAPMLGFAQTISQELPSNGIKTLYYQVAGTAMFSNGPGEYDGSVLIKDLSIIESNPNNNFASFRIKVTGPLVTNLPDLCLEADQGGIQWTPAHLIENHPMQIQIRLRNIGSGDAINPSVRFWLPSANGGPSLPLESTYAEILHAGEYVVLEFPLALAAPGGEVVLMADPDGLIRELDESNNYLSPKLIVSSSGDYMDLAVAPLTDDFAIQEIDSPTNSGSISLKVRSVGTLPYLALPQSPVYLHLATERNQIRTELQPLQMDSSLAAGAVKTTYWQGLPLSQLSAEQPNTIVAWLTENMDVDPSNDSRTWKITLPPAGKTYDLAITSFSATPEDVTLAQDGPSTASIQFEIGLANLGTAGDVEADLEIIDESTGKVIYGKSQTFAAAASFVQKTQCVLGAGLHSIRAVINPRKVVYETDWNNNAQALVVNLHTDAAELPDLQFEPGTVRVQESEDTLLIDGYVRNASLSNQQAAATSAFVVRAELVDEATTSALAAFSVDSGLAGDSLVHFAMRCAKELVFPNGSQTPAGIIRLEVDADHEVVEANENNNLYSAPWRRIPALTGNLNMLVNEAHLNWAPATGLDEAGYIGRDEIAGYLLVRLKNEKWDEQRVVNDLLYRDYNLDPGATYTYLVSILTRDGRQGPALLLSGNTGVVPTLVAMPEAGGEVFAQSIQLEATSGAPYRVRIRVHAPGVEKIFLTHTTSMGVTGEDVENPTEDGYFEAVRTLSFGVNEFQAQEKRQTPDGYLLGYPSNRCSIYYTAGVDLATSPYLIKAKWYLKAIDDYIPLTPEQSYKIPDGTSITVTATILNLEKHPSGNFKVKLIWEHYDRKLLDKQEIAKTVTCHLGGFDCTTVTASIAKPTGRFLKKFRVEVDPDQEVRESLESNNNAEVLLHGCMDQSYVIFLVDSDMPDTGADSQMQRAAGELRYLALNEFNSTHTIALVTYKTGGSAQSEPYVGSFLSYDQFASLAATTDSLKGKLKVNITTDLASAFARAQTLISSIPTVGNPMVTVVLINASTSSEPYAQRMKMTDTKAASAMKSALYDRFGANRYHLYNLHVSPAAQLQGGVYIDNDRYWQRSEEAALTRQLTSEIDSFVTKQTGPDANFLIKHHYSGNDSPIYLNGPFAINSTTKLQRYPTPSGLTYPNDYHEGCSEILFNHDQWGNISDDNIVAEVSVSRASMLWLLVPSDQLPPQWFFEIGNRPTKMWQGAGRWGYFFTPKQYSIQRDGYNVPMENWYMPLPNFINLKIGGSKIGEGINNRSDFIAIIRADTPVDFSSDQPDPTWPRRELDPYIKYLNYNYDRIRNGINFLNIYDCDGTPPPAEADLVPSWAPSENGNPIGFPYGLPSAEKSGKLIGCIENQGSKDAESVEYRLEQMIGTQTTCLTDWTSLEATTGMANLIAKYRMGVSFSWHHPNTAEVIKLGLRVRTTSTQSSTANDIVWCEVQPTRDEHYPNLSWGPNARINDRLLTATTTINLDWDKFWGNTLLIDLDIKSENRITSQTNVMLSNPVVNWDGIYLPNLYTSESPLYNHFNRSIRHQVTLPQNELLTLKLGLDSLNRVLESSDEDNTRTLEFNVHYRTQDAMVGQARVVNESSDGILTVAAEIGCSSNTLFYPCHSVSCAIYDGIYQEGSALQANVYNSWPDQRPLIVWSADTPGTQTVLFRIPKAEIFTNSLSIVVDPSGLELSEMPDVGRMNNVAYLSLTSTPLELNLRPVQFTVLQDQQVVESVLLDASTSLSLLNHYDVGADIQSETSYTVQFWDGYPGHASSRLIAEQPINQSVAEWEKHIAATWQASAPAGERMLYAIVDPTNHLAHAANADALCTTFYQHKQLFGLLGIEPHVQQAGTLGSWRVRVGVADNVSLTSHSWVGEWDAQSGELTNLATAGKRGPILLTLDAITTEDTIGTVSLPRFSESDYIVLRFSEPYYTPTVRRLDPGTSETPAQYGWYVTDNNTTYPAQMVYTTVSHKNTPVFDCSSSTATAPLFRLGATLATINSAADLAISDMSIASIQYRNLADEDAPHFRFMVDTNAGDYELDFATTGTVTTLTAQTIKIGLGHPRNQGAWETLTLNLEEQLQRLLPTVTLNKISGFAVQANHLQLSDVLFVPQWRDLDQLTPLYEELKVPLADWGSNATHLVFWVAEDGSLYHANSLHNATAEGVVDLSPAQALHDEHGRVIESNEDDNQIMAHVQVIAPAGVDLALQNLVAQVPDNCDATTMVAQMDLNNLLAAHRQGGDLVLTVDGAGSVTTPIDRWWAEKETLPLKITLDLPGTSGVHWLRAKLYLEDQQTANNIATTSFSTICVRQMGIGQPLPNPVVSGTTIQFPLSMAATPAMLSDITLWLMNDVGETVAELAAPELSGLNVSTSSTLIMNWPLVVISPGHYSIYGEMRNQQSGYVAAKAISPTFEVLDQCRGELQFAMAQSQFTAGSAVPVALQLRNLSLADWADTVTLQVVASSDTSATEQVQAIPLSSLEAGGSRQVQFVFGGLTEGVKHLHASLEMPCGGTLMADAWVELGAASARPMEQVDILTTTGESRRFVNTTAVQLKLGNAGNYVMSSLDRMWLNFSRPPLRNPLGFFSGIGLDSRLPHMLQSGATAMYSDEIAVEPQAEYCLAIDAMCTASAARLRVDLISNSGGDDVVWQSWYCDLHAGTDYELHEFAFVAPLWMHQLKLMLSNEGNAPIETGKIWINAGRMAQAAHPWPIKAANRIPQLDGWSSHSLQLYPYFEEIPYCSLEAFSADRWQLLADEPDLPAALLRHGLNDAHVLQGTMRLEFSGAATAEPLEMQFWQKGASGLLELQTTAGTTLASLALTTGTQWSSHTLSVSALQQAQGFALRWYSAGTMQLAGLQLATADHCHEIWSGFVSYQDRLNTNLNPLDYDGLRPVHVRYATSGAQLSRNGLVAFTHQVAGSGPANGNAVTTASYQMNNSVTWKKTNPVLWCDGDPSTSTSLDALNALRWQTQLERVRFMDCLYLGASFNTTVTLTIEATLEGTLWLPIATHQFAPGRCGKLLPLDIAARGLRLKFSAIQGDEFAVTINEIEVRGPADTDTDAVVLDRVAPQVVLQAPLISASMTTGTAIVSGSTSDSLTGLSKIEYHLDDQAWTTISVYTDWVTTAAFQMQFLTTDSLNHVVQVRALDRAGNVSASALTSYSLDREAPIMVIDAPSSFTWSNHALPLLWHSTSNDLLSSSGLLQRYTFNAELLQTDEVSCGAMAATEGRYLLSATGTDASGNVSMPARTAFGIDLTKPIVSLAGNNGRTSSSLLNITGSASDGAGQSGLSHVMVRIDAGAWTTATAMLPAGNFQAAWSNQAQGAHVVWAQAWDHAGNSGATSTTITIDNTPPVMVIDAPTSFTWSNQPLQVRWHTLADDLASSIGLAYRKNFGETTETLHVMADHQYASQQGRYRLEVQGRDLAGNVGNPAQTAFGIDLTSPTVTVQGYGSDPDQCRDFYDMMVVLDRSGSMDNSNRITAARNQIARLVDEILHQPFQRVGLVSFNATASVNAFFAPLNYPEYFPMCLLGTVAGCTPIAADDGTSIKAGFDLAVQQMMVAGLRSTANPVLLLVDDGDNTTFGFDDVESAMDAKNNPAFEGRLKIYNLHITNNLADGWGTGTSGLLMHNLTSSHDVKVTPTTRTLENAFMVKPYWAKRNSPAAMHLNLNNQPEVWTGSGSWLLQPGDTYTYKGNYLLGLTQILIDKDRVPSSSISSLASFRVDRTSRVIIQWPVSQTKPTWLTNKWRAYKNHDRYGENRDLKEYSINSGTTTTLTTFDAFIRDLAPNEVFTLGGGQVAGVNNFYMVHVLADPTRDPAGEQYIRPVQTINSGTGSIGEGFDFFVQNICSKKLFFNGTVTDGAGSGVTRLEARLNNDAWTTAPYSLNTGGFLLDYGYKSDGNYTIQMRAYDQAGNIRHTSNSLLLDINRPTVTLQLQTPNPSNNPVIQVSGQAIDGTGSGVQEVRLQINGSAWLTPGTFNSANGTYSHTFSGVADGQYTITAVAVDHAGLLSSAVQTTTNIDTTPPTVIIDSPVNNSWSTQSVQVTWHAVGADLATSHGTVIWTSLSTPATSATLQVKAGDWLTSEGTYQLQITGTDRAGNESTPTQCLFGIDYPELGYLLKGLYGDSKWMGVWQMLARQANGNAPLKLMVAAYKPDPLVSQHVWFELPTLDSIKHRRRLYGASHTKDDTRFTDMALAESAPL
jgi:hypothetical protein